MLIFFFMKGILTVKNTNKATSTNNLRTTNTSKGRNLKEKQD